MLGIASRSDTGYAAAYERLSAGAEEAARKAAGEGASPMDILYSRLHEGYLALLRMESEGKAGTPGYEELEMKLRGNVNMYNLGLADQEKQRKKERGSSQSLTVVAKGIKSRFMARQQEQKGQKTRSRSARFDQQSP